MFSMLQILSHTEVPKQPYENAHIVIIWHSIKDIGKRILDLSMKISKNSVVDVVTNFQINPMYIDIRENCIVRKLYLVIDLAKNGRKTYLVTW